MTQSLRHQRQCIGGREPALQARELIFCLLIALTDDRHHAGQDRNMLRRAAMLHHALLQAVIGSLGRDGVAVDH